MQPGFLPAVQEAAVIQAKHRIADDETTTWLGEIRQRADDESWRRWADLELAKREVKR